MSCPAGPRAQRFSGEFDIAAPPAEASLDAGLAYRAAAAARGLMAFSSLACFFLT